MAVCNGIKPEKLTMNTLDSSKLETRTEPDQLSCDICMEEIPTSEAGNSEASDYVIYYFGIECFGTWSKHR